MKTHDRFDMLIAAVRAREWPGPPRNSRFEEFLMNEKGKHVRLRRRTGLFLAIGSLFTCGAVYGAARLYERFVTVTINGQEAAFTDDTSVHGLAEIMVPQPDGTTKRVVVGPGHADSNGRIGMGFVVNENGEIVQSGDLGALHLAEDGTFSVEIPEGAEVEIPDQDDGSDTR